MKKAAVFTLLLSMSIGLSVSCTNTVPASSEKAVQTGNNVAKPIAEANIKGNIYLSDINLKDAKISIYDSSNKLIYEKDKATTDSNEFSITSDKELTSGFRIVVTGGTLSNKAFNGKLMYEVKDHKSSNSYKISPVSTMVCAYMDKNKVDLAKAQESVKKYLNLGSIDFDPKYFDIVIFFGEAESNGGFDKFISNLIDLINKGENAGSRFSPPTGLNWI